MFFRRWASNRQDSPKASPRVIFSWKNLISRTWLNESKVEKAAYQHAPICALTCQHGPTLQFVSCAEKGKLSHGSMPLYTSVFFCGCASNGQDSPKANQPKGSFQLKELHRTTTAIGQMNPDWKVEKAQYAEFNVPTCGKIAVWQLCSETQPLWKCHDSWWPELKMFGSMPWCSFPGYTFFRVNALLYSSLNMIDEFTSLFRQRQLLHVRLGQLSHRSMPLWTSVFFRRWASNSLDSPKCYFQLKELDIKNSIEPLKLLSQWLKSGEGCIPTWANLCPYLPAWANIAVGQLCRERQPLWNSRDSWWPELKIFGSMPWCSFPFQNLLPCHTTAWIWSVSLQLFTSVFKTKPDLCRSA